VKVIMYHYIGEPGDFPDNFRYLDFDNFRKQLDFFSSKYEFANKDDWQEYDAFGDFRIFKNKVMLTFDDGLSCHKSLVTDELQGRNIWGLFFVSNVMRRKELQCVHKIHVLTSTLPIDVQ
jgi:hypothetical protein